MKLSYCLKVVIFALFGITFSAFVHAQTALPPIITKQPVASSTHAQSAKLMLYVQALPRDEGTLTYQWYYYTPVSGDNFSYPLAESNISTIKTGSVKVPGAGSAQYTLDATTPAAGTYYYWCRITNTNGSATSSVESSITRIIVVNRNLEPQLMNGDFQTYSGIFPLQGWNSNGTGTNNYMHTPVAALLENTYLKMGTDSTITQEFLPYWNTTHNGGGNNTGALTENNAGNGKVIELQDIGRTANNDGQGRGLPTAGHAVGSTTVVANATTFSNGVALVAELSAAKRSSVYQDIATTPGKIYEWSIDHGAVAISSGNTVNTLAVVIGPAINNASDYISVPTGQNRWVNSALYQIGSTTGNTNYIYRTVGTTLRRYNHTYPYGRNDTTYFNDIVNTLRLPTEGNNTAGNNAFGVRIRSMSATDRVKVVNYNGQKYYVYLSTGEGVTTASTATVKNGKWTPRNGYYSVPEGIGTTFFAFVSINSEGDNAGNFLDNIVFKSGHTPVSATAMFYSGRVSLSAATDTGYVYGIAEIRGSSVILLPNDNVEWYTGDKCPDGTNCSISPHKSGDFANDSISNWFYPNKTGNIAFNNLVPGKTYRIVGIPFGAVSLALYTNCNPSLVLDDGYYTEITIPAAFTGNDKQMATATSSAQTCDYASIFLTNTNSNVEYTVLEKSDSTAIADWKHGLGVATGAALIFDSLKTNHDYLVVARPAGYDEMNYKTAAKLSAVLIHTPTPTYCLSNPGNVDDILRSQVTRDHDGAKDKITLTGIDSDGEYGLYNPEDGIFLGWGPSSLTPTGLIKGKDVPGATPTGGGTITFTGLDPTAIYHLAVRDTITGSVFMVGVRVYPFAPLLNINYEKEWIQRASDSTYVPKEVEYRMRAENYPDSTWLIGSGEAIDFEKNTTWQAASGTSHLYLGYPRGNLTAILDSMKILAADTARLYYRMHPVEVDGWTGPSIAPESTPLAIPKRPEAPEKQDCPPPDPPSGGDYKLDYTVLPEEISFLSIYNMQYSTDNGQTYAPPAGMTGDIALAALGYTGAEMTVFLRFPWGMTPTAHFASEVSRQVVLGRGAAPTEAYAVIDNVTNSLINILGLRADKQYQYKLTTSTTWIPVNPGETSIMGLPLESEDYEIRYVPVCENPASHSQMLSVPLSVEAIDFGSLDCGYDVNGRDSIIHIRNVSTNPVPFTDISIDNTTDFILNVPASPTKVVSAMNGDVLGSNTEYSISPRPGLGVGSYQARITLTYTYNGNTNTATADVFLTVETATPDNNLEAKATDVTATTFTLEIDAATIPAGAVIEYHINPFGSDTITPFVGVADMQVIDDTHFFDLQPATEYTIWYRYKSDMPCYYASPAKSITVQTPYTLDCSKPVVQIDYVAEMLQFKDGFLSDHYEVRVNDVPVNMPYRVSAEADAGDFEVSVRLISTGSNTTFPPSDPCSFIVKGRRDAPATVTTSPAITIVNDVKYGNTFEYRVAGNSNIMANWIGPVTTYTPTVWGGYEVRRKAIATTIVTTPLGSDTTIGVFASKFTTVFVEAALVPHNRVLYVDIARMDGLGLGNGSSWQNATPSLSSALACPNVDSIYVAIGTYKPGSGGTFTLPSNVVVTGGFQYTWKSDPSDQYTNTINNKDASSILSGDLGAAGNALHVVTANGGGGTTATSTLDRFVITAGNASGAGAGSNGGGVYLTNNSSLKLINVLIHSNTATGNGGGIYVDNGCTDSLTNVTISANTAASGGGIYRETSGTVIVNNTIIYGNSTDEVNATTGMTFNHSLVKGQTLAGTGNLDSATDPLFVNAAAKNFHLQKSSPARDAGDNALYVLAGRDPSSSSEGDVAGNPRLSNASIDVGAYEFLPILKLRVDTTCSGVPYSYTAESAPAGITFEWTRAEVAGISNLAGSGNSENINETLDNLRSTPVNVKYAFTLTLPSGRVSHDTLTVTVRVPFTAGKIVDGDWSISNPNDEITINSELNASGGDGNITYQWTKTGNDGVETEIPDSNSPTYTIPVADMAISGSDTIRLVYKRYAHDSICSKAFTASGNEFKLMITKTSAPADLTVSGVWPYWIIPTTGGYYTGDSHTGSPGGIDINGRILIIGTGFEMDKFVTVTLGGVPCKVDTVMNDQMILCIPGASTDTAMNVPAVLADTKWHEGWVDVKVAVDNGNKTAVGKDSCFYRHPLTISSVTPDNGPVAGGTQVTITGYNFLNYYGTTRPKVIFSVPGGDLSPAVADTVTVSNTRIVVKTAAHLANHVAVTVNNLMEKSDTVNVFTYYPTVYIKDGRWTDYENWEDHSTENIVPYDWTSVHGNVGAVHIKANMEQDRDVDLDSITVYPLKSYTVGNGAKVTANVFTLKDDASFLNFGVDAIGTARVQHTLTKGRNWYISSPMKDDVTPPTVSSALSTATDGTAITTRVESYDETNHQWESVTGGFTIGQGYTAFNQNKDIAANFTGKFTDGKVTPPTSPTLTRSTDGHPKRGFNLVGNPFPSYWRWTAEAADAANLYATIWYRTYIHKNTDASENYEFWSYNAAGDVAVAPGWEDDEMQPGYNLSYIPPMQAFWVRVQEGKTDGTLTFDNEERRHANQSANILKSAETRPMLRLAISDGKSTDETLIYADKEALNAFDRFDSEKMFANAGVELFTVAPDENILVINGLNEIKAGTEIPLSFRADAAGAFDLKAQQILNLDTLDVFLRDNLRQLEFDLKNEPVYNFTSGSEPSPDRFSIVFRSLGAESDLSGKMSAYENGLKQIVVNNYEGIVYVYDLNGLLLAEDVITKAGKVINRRFTSGVYVIRGGGQAVKIVVR